MQGLSISQVCGKQVERRDYGVDEVSKLISAGLMPTPISISILFLTAVYGEYHRIADLAAPNLEDEIVH